MAFVANSPFPYTTPILNALATEVELDVIYMHSVDPMYGLTDVWGETPRFRYLTQASRALWIERADFRVQVALGVSRTISRLNPDVVIVTSWGPLTIEPLIWAALRHRRSVIWSESPRFSGRFRDPLSQTARRAIVRVADAYVTNGTLAADFLLQLGARRDRVIVGCLPSPSRLLPTRSSTAGVRFLFVGRLVARKHPEMVLDAFGQILERSPAATLTIVGDGPLRAEVERTAAALGPSVRVLGHLEGADIAGAYSGADVLVMPAEREVWGLVVNEALAAGLYVIASDQVASAHDLLDPKSGRVVGARDLAALTAAIADAARSLDRSPEAIDHRRERVADCTPAAFAGSMARAVDLAFGRS